MTVYSRLSERDVAVLASRRLKTDGKSLLTLQTFVPNALNDLTQSVSADPEKRRLLVTDFSTVTASITTNSAGGRYYADLSTVIQDYGVALDQIRLGSVFYLPSQTATPYLLAEGGHASGYWTLNVNPVSAETISVNGVTFTFQQPSLTVAGGGSTAQNGTFVYAGISGGHPQYLGGDDGTYIRFVEDTWYVYNEAFEVMYSTQSDAYQPWDATGWEVGAQGTAPVPTFTQVALTSADVEIGDKIATTADNFTAVLNASTDPLVSVASYVAGYTAKRGHFVTGTYDTAGTAGNSFTMGNSSGGTVQRSAATFTGGTPSAYGLYVSNGTEFFHDLDRVRFTSTGSLPTGISAATDYYITNYSAEAGVKHFTFTLSSTPDGLTPATITTQGSGVLTVQNYGQNVAQWLRSPNQGFLTPALPVTYPYIWLEQNHLYTSVYPGMFSFAVPYQPPSLATLPAQLENDLIDALVAIALTAGFEPNSRTASK